MCMYLMPLNCGLTNVNCLTLFNTLFNTGSHIIFCLFYLFIGYTGSSVLHVGFSLVAAGATLVVVPRVLIVVASLVAECTL